MAGDVLDVRGLLPSQMHSALMGGLVWLEGRESGEQLPSPVGNVLRVRSQLCLVECCHIVQSM